MSVPRPTVLGVYLAGIMLLVALLWWSVKFQHRHWQCCSSEICGTQGHHKEK